MLLVFLISIFSWTQQQTFWVNLYCGSFAAYHPQIQREQGGGLVCLLMPARTRSSAPHSTGNGVFRIVNFGNPSNKTQKKSVHQRGTAESNKTTTRKVF